MPIYEYACAECGYQFEVFQGIRDPALVICEKCEKPSLSKLVSAAGFRLKGGGWYETDFKKAGDKKKNLVTNENSVAPVSKVDSGNSSSADS